MMKPCNSCTSPIYCKASGRCDKAIRLPIAISFSDVELGMIVLAMHQLDPSDHRAEFFELRGRLTKAWSESMPDQYRMATVRGEVQPWGPDAKAGKTVSDEATVVRETRVVNGMLAESVRRCPEEHLQNFMERLPGFSCMDFVRAK